MKSFDMRSQRAVYIIVLAALICVMLSSFGHGKSIDRRGLVHAMGIDRTTDGYRVSLQIFQPSEGGDNAVDVTKPNVSVTVSEGRTVGEAVASAGSSLGKELFFGHLQLICLGTDTEPDDPYELFAFALGDKNISPSVDICCCKGSAEELMQTKVSDAETSAEALTDLIKNGSENSAALRCDLKGLLSSGGISAVPLLEVKEDTSDNSGSNSKALSECVSIAGTKVTCTDIVLSAKETRAAALLEGRAKKGCIAVKQGGADITCIIDKSRRRRKVSAENGGIVLHTAVTVSVIPDRELSPAESGILGRTVSAELESECNALQNRLFSAGADIFGTEQLIRQRMPAAALKYQGKKLYITPETEVIVKVI